MSERPEASQTATNDPRSVFHTMVTVISSIPFGATIFTNFLKVTCYHEDIAWAKRAELIKIAEVNGCRIHHVSPVFGSFAFIVAPGKPNPIAAHIDEYMYMQTAECTVTSGEARMEPSRLLEASYL